MMIENVLDAQEFEWQRNENNVVGGITPFNDVEPVP
jgi:hypothetical protein